MVRPKKSRQVRFQPQSSYWKPRGVPLKELETLQLTVDEVEALRLADFLGMSQEDAGAQMGVSRATFGRIVQNARKVVADALLHGKALEVSGGEVTVVPPEGLRHFKCMECKGRWEEPYGTGRPGACPHCGSPDLKREDGACSRGNKEAGEGSG